MSGDHQEDVDGEDPGGHVDHHGGEVESEDGQQDVHLGEDEDEEGDGGGDVDEGEGEDVDRVYRQLVRRSCKFF